MVDKRIYNSEINTDVVNATEDTAYKKQYEDNRAGKSKGDEPWFTPVNFTSCEIPADYVCPPLTSEKISSGYTTRVNFVDLVSGKISCSAHLTTATNSDALNGENQIKDHTEVFINKSCLEKYSASENTDESEDIKQLKDTNKNYIDELKAQEYKYTVDYKNSGDNKFLDLADILDGIVSFNVEVFDFEQTLLTRELKTRNGYTTLPNEMIITKFEASFSNLVGLLTGFDSHSQNEFLKNAENQASIRNASSAIANSSYFMLLEFWLKANDILVLLAQALAFIFIAHNAILTWALPAISNKIAQKKDYDNHIQRATVGFLALIMLFAGDVEKLNIQYESKAQDLVQNELIIQQTNMQTAIQLLYAETNYWADAIAEIGIRSYLNSLSGSSGLFNDKQIEAMATEKKVLQKSMESYRQIETDMCYANYDVKTVSDKVKSYRASTLSKNDGENSVAGVLLDGTISSVDANPFPKSEAEAVAIMKQGMPNKYVAVSPYNSSAADTDSGLVKDISKEKFRDPAYAPLSLSGCYENTKKRIAANQRIKEIEAQFAKLGSETNKNATVEYLKVVNEIQWRMFAEQGYLSIVYLPVVNLVLQNLGVIDELENLSKLDEKEENAITDFVEDGIKELSSDIPVLMMFGGTNVAKMIHVIKKPIINFMFNQLSVLGGPIAKGASVGRKALDALGEKSKEISEEYDILDLKLAAMLIKSVLNSLVMALLLGSSILVFTLLFIEKLFAFIASMFLLIYAFAKNQEERMGTAIAKIVAVAFKTILIVVCVILSMWALYLVTFLQHSLLNNFFNSMDAIENASWSYMFESFNFSDLGSVIKTFFDKYIVYGVVSVTFMVVKMVLVVQMIWKMPGFMYELIYEKVNSVSDSVGESLQNANEKAVLKV